MHVDVAVIGGGSAGIAAAVAAARSGARVALIERRGSLGGQVPGALVHAICGLYLLREDEAQPLIPANPGFPTEFANRLLEAGGARGPVRMGRLDVLLHEPAAFALLAGRLCANEPGLNVCVHTEILEARANECGGGMALGLSRQGRHELLEAAAVVDATGDGVVAALAGAGWAQAPADKLQRPAYIFKLSGVEPGSLSGDERIRIAQALSAAVIDGHLPTSALGTAFRIGLAVDDVWATMDLAAEGFDPFDSLCRLGIESAGHDAALRVSRFLRENIAGFHRATIAALPERAGVRESRRISGQYELSSEDIRSGATFADAAARAAWPMELREKPTGPKLRFPAAIRPCAIPLRALRSRAVNSLFMAGRCISCSHEAQASIRVIGTCLATGEAAGIAAASHADQVPRVEKIR